jgi:hypothetical protein
MAAMKLRTLAAALFCAVLHGVTAAQPAPAAPAPCSAATHRAFDFWIGDWDVRTPDGKLVGRNRIEAGYGGCALHERYETPGGYRGESLNAYDATRGTWHQTWVDTGGLVLRLEGGPVEGGMLLQGEGRARDGTRLRHRIRWTLLPDGRVRQLWETARGDGEAWPLNFDGLYQRR